MHNFRAQTMTPGGMGTQAAFRSSAQGNTGFPSIRVLARRVAIVTRAVEQHGPKGVWGSQTGVRSLTPKGTSNIRQLRFQPRTGRGSHGAFTTTREDLDDHARSTGR